MRRLCQRDDPIWSQKAGTQIWQLLLQLHTADVGALLPAGFLGRSFLKRPLTRPPWLFLWLNATAQALLSDGNQEVFHDGKALTQISADVWGAAFAGAHIYV